MKQETLNAFFTELKTEFSEITVMDYFPEEQPSFPCVIMEYEGNTTDIDSVDTSGEKFTIERLTIHVFTSGEKKKTTATGIQSRINGIFSGKYRMSRVTQVRTSEFLNRELYKIETTYEFKIDAQQNVYRR